MKYRIRLDLILNSDKETLANKVYNALLIEIKDHAKIINKGLANEEKSYLELEHCGHDEGEPCIILRRLEAK